MTDYLSLLPLITLLSITSLILSAVYLYRQNQALKSRQKNLEEQLFDKQEIISVAAHEIASPLTNIKGTLSIVAKDFSRDPANPLRKYVDRALISIEELISLIDGLLTVSRFEQGKIQINKVPTDLPALCRRVVDELKGQAEKAGLALVYQAESPQGLALQTARRGLREAPDPVVSCDPDRLREVLINLITNALKYSKEGTILLTTKLSPKGHPLPFDDAQGKPGGGPEEPESLVVSVSDNGPGISRADLPKIFQRFVRLPAPPAGGGDGRPGVGLGLYIARLIVEAHGGKIWAESPSTSSGQAAGQGTTFYFSLPL